MSTQDSTCSPIIVCVAPNGARRGKREHARLPLTADELAGEAARIEQAGAHALHLHVRDDAGLHSLDPMRYRAAIAAIRARVADRLLIQVTTEAAGVYRPEEQMAAMRELTPELMSVAIRELIPDAAHERAAAEFLAWAHDRRIGVQFILYSPGEVATFIALHARGLIPSNAPHGLFVLGRYATSGVSDPHELLGFVAEWPREWPWTVCAFGRTEPLCLAAAIALGGHVRVGFENNLTAPDGTLARDNAALVENVRRLIECTGRPLATASEALAIYAR